MGTPETISPPIDKRRIPGLLVLILVFIIALAAVSANAALRRRVQESQQAENSLLRLQMHAYHFSALEWEIIGNPEIYSEIVEDVRNVHYEVDRLIRELEQLDPNSENLRSVRQAHAAYDSAVTEVFGLIAAGDFDQARLVDERQVEPSFNVFSQALESTGATYSAKAKQAESVGDLGTALVLIFTAAAIALLFWRFQKAQVATEVANTEQRALARHRDDFRLLNEMGNRLRTCLTVAEAYDIIANFARPLFPNVSGALYVINTTPGIFESVITWGESQPRLPGSGRELSQDKCWALRRGQMYTSEDSTSHGGLCPYLGQPRPDGYLCVPMLARGETLGVLHLRYSKPPRTSEIQSAEGMVVLKRQLAETVAEHIALALTNLRLQEALRYQAIRDPLTGLFNRRYMEETFKRELDRASRRKTTVGVIMLDIDNFKLFNDTFGHAAGDAVLIEVSALLKAHVRGEDIPCRYGGEELLLILLEAQLRDTHRRAEQLRSEIQHLSVQYEGQSLGAITVSLGIASYPEHGATVESLLAAADSALYRAKNEGRNQSVVAQAGGE